jgi:hypothetical protein
MTIHVIGAGFGRTGTASLQQALQLLGYNKCYHMREIRERVEDTKVWHAAMDGMPVDWDTLFADYQATVDWPGCTFYQALMRHYPKAKVILTVRDPDRWHASAMQTIYGVRSIPLSEFGPLAEVLRELRPMQDHVIWNGTFHGRFADKQYAIDVLHRHNDEVKRVVPPERLLVYEVSQGWGPLCRFLDRPVPAEPFPHLNTSAEYAVRTRQWAEQAPSADPTEPAR